jgi:hypothetical protein
MNEWMDGWMMDGWMDEWMDGWMDGKKEISGRKRFQNVVSIQKL